MPTSLRDVPGPVGPLEALLDLPRHAPRAVVVFAHPHPVYGGTLHTKMVYQAAKALARIGCAVLRFNFRGVGRSAGTFDAGVGEMDDFRAALDAMAERYPGLPLWAAGASFGAWIALTVGATDPRVTVLLALAPPVDRYDFEALRTCTKPKFFVHGERDEVVSIKQVRGLYAQVPEPKELVEIEGGTHLFDGRTMEIGEAIEDLLTDFDVPAPSGTRGTVEQ